MKSVHTRLIAIPANFSSGFSRISSKSSVYQVKFGIPEFLKGVGSGVEAHVEKLENEIGDFQKLLVTCTFKHKKLEIPCKHARILEASNLAGEKSLIRLQGYIL